MTNRLQQGWKGCVAVALAVAAMQGVAAQAQDALFLSPGGAVEAPRGFVEMCRTQTDFCAQGMAAGDPALVTGALAVADPVAPAVAGPAADVAGKAQPNFAPAAASLTNRRIVPLQTLVLQVDAAPLFAPHLLPVVSMTGLPDAGFAPAPIVPTDLRIAPLAELGRPDEAAPPFASVAQPITPDGEGWRGGLAILAPSIAMPAPSPLDVVVASVASEPGEAASPAPDAIETGEADRADQQLLRRVNRFVNSHVRQRSDMEIYGRDEYWHRSGVGPSAAGDCEDIAIEKRIELIAAGFSPDRLYFAVVYAREVGLHTVLVARTREGDMVLDSRNGFVVNWTKAPYSWISIQSMREPMVWYAAGAAPPPTPAINMVRAEPAAPGRSIS